MLLMTKEINPIGRRIRQFRAEKGLTQLQLCQAADVSLSLLTKLEQTKGDPPDVRYSKLLALATALGVKVGQLTDDT